MLQVLSPEICSIAILPQVVDSCKNRNKISIIIWMSDITFNYYPQFFTATILEWKHLLVDIEVKEIIISTLQFLVNKERVKIYGFVLMPNHIYLVWQIQDGHECRWISFLILLFGKMLHQLPVAGDNTRRETVEPIRLNVSYSM